MNILKKALLVVLGAGLVVVPSTVDKVEEVNAAMTFTSGQAFYLTPNANWEQSNARFAVYFFGNGETWQSMTKVSNGDTVYRVVINSTSATKNSMIFCRMNPSATANNWNNKWNQTSDITSASGNMYTVKEGTWDKGGGTWSTYKEFGYTLYTNDGTGSTFKTAKKQYEYGKTATLIEETPVREGYNFVGWSTSSTATTATYQPAGTIANVTADVKLYAVWEEKAATDCTLTFNVGTHEFHNTVTAGSLIEESIPEAVKESGFEVLAWDKKGAVSADTKITATKYYKTIDEVKGELNFSYSYLSKLVYFECPIGYDDGVPAVTGTNTKTGATKTVEMSWCADAPNGKKAWYTNLEIEYDKLTFKWKNGGTSMTHTVTRDFDKVAIWYDSATSNGNYVFDLTTNVGVATGVQYQVGHVDNMKLRVGTLAMLASDFAGVETYGIRIAKGNTIADDNFYGPKWSAEDITKVDANGDASETGEYIRWNAVINNIPSENYNDEFTATAYVVIDGVNYDLAKPRTVSVTSLAKIYTSVLEGVESSACQYIVDTFAA